MQRELKLRILSGIVMAVVVLAATYAGGLTFRLLSALIALLIFYEWTTITGDASRFRKSTIVGWVFMAAIALCILSDPKGAAVALLLIYILASFVDHLPHENYDTLLPQGFAYAGLTGISLAMIRGDDHAGLIAMIFVFSVVWSTDILAYFVGRALRGPKLAPRISPGKTWSGAIGGAIAAVAISTLVASFFMPLDSARLPLLALGLSIASQTGDLFESYVKRRFGVKDSGHLIPGHGGVMDRADGLIFASIAALAWVLLIAYTTGRAMDSPGAILLGL